MLISICQNCVVWQPNKSSTYVTILARLPTELIFIRQFNGFRCWICQTDYLFSQNFSICINDPTFNGDIPASVDLVEWLFLNYWLCLLSYQSSSVRTETVYNNKQEHYGLHCSYQVSLRQGQNLTQKEDRNREPLGQFWVSRTYNTDDMII